jgi:hypothetical protein
LWWWWLEAKAVAENDAANNARKLRSTNFFIVGSAWHTGGSTG